MDKLERWIRTQIGTAETELRAWEDHWYPIRDWPEYEVVEMNINQLHCEINVLKSILNRYINPNTIKDVVEEGWFLETREEVWPRLLVL